MAEDPQERNRVLAAAAQLMSREGIGAATMARVGKDAGVPQRALRRMFGNADRLRTAVLSMRPASEVADLLAKAARSPEAMPLSVLIEAMHRLYEAPQRSWTDADLEELVRARADPELREAARRRFDERTENVRQVVGRTLGAEILDPGVSAEALVHFLMSLSAGLGLLDAVATNRPSMQEWDGLIARIGQGLAHEQRRSSSDPALDARWRLRVEVPDRPRSLAELVGALAVLGVYTGEVRVEEGAAGQRVLYLILLAPAEVSSDVILASAASAGTDAYITAGSPDDSEDLMARMLDAATELLRHPGEAPSLAAALVEADRFEVIDAADGVDDQDRVLRLQWTAMQHVVLFREWGPFTRTEQIRASALLRLSTQIATGLEGQEPAGWVEQTRSGPVWIRLARPRDAKAVAAMHERSSERTRYLRYQSLRTWPELQLRRLSGGHRGATLVVIADRKVIGLGNVFPDSESDGHSAEVALLVEDEYQGKGVGKVLLARMLHLAARQGFSEVVAHVLSDNGGMRHVLGSTGLEWRTSTSSGMAVMRATLPAQEQG